MVTVGPVGPAATPVCCSATPDPGGPAGSAIPTGEPAVPAVTPAGWAPVGSAGPAGSAKPVTGVSAGPAARPGC
ncbi:Uncharacterised protein [Mycobacterium tuberculosis]|nr:Uncharacterised protein [Mycobacterium tuberculosis]